MGELLVRVVVRIALIFSMAFFSSITRMAIAIVRAPLPGPHLHGLLHYGHQFHGHQGRPQGSPRAPPRRSPLHHLGLLLLQSPLHSFLLQGLLRGQIPHHLHELGCFAFALGPQEVAVDLQPQIGSSSSHRGCA